MMGWLILVITLSSFQLVKLDSVFVGGGMLGEVVEITQVKSELVCKSTIKREYRIAEFNRLQLC